MTDDDMWGNIVENIFSRISLQLLVTGKPRKESRHIISTFLSLMSEKMRTKL